MADLGNLIGSLMTGLIRARQMADEQTAALAEYYKQNPLLEGLSVPRIRIPELTIDIPFLVEDHIEGKTAELEDTSKVVAAVDEQIKKTITKTNLKVEPVLQKKVLNEIKSQIVSLKQAETPITQETLTRRINTAVIDTLSQSKQKLTDTQKEEITKVLRNTLSSISISKKPVAPSVVANIKTADVKERSSSTNVVRLKITMKEEGLEWATQTSETGDVTRTLQAE